MHKDFSVKMHGGGDDWLEGTACKEMNTGVEALLVGLVVSRCSA